MRLLRLILICIAHQTICVEDGDDASLYFIKDDGMDSKFPPSIGRSMFEEIPMGHLRSLGHQRASDGPVTQVKEEIDPEKFLKDYVIKEEPLTIRGAIKKDEPLRAIWNDDRLNKIHGDSKVWVVKRHENSNKRPFRTNLTRFLDFYKLQDIYIASTMPDELLKEIMYPKFLTCPPITQSLVEAELWMAYGGTGSLLHYHGDHQVHCLADGRKDFILIHPKFKSLLKMIEKHPFTGEGYSLLNTDMINMFEEKQIAEVAWTFSTLLSGDCLYIPNGYIHQVRSFGRSLSFSLQFAPTYNMSTKSGCKSVEESTLNQFDFMYTERDGIEQLKNTKLTAGDVRQILQKLIRKNSVLPFEAFQYFYNVAIGKVSKKMPTARSVFNNLDRKGEGHISTEEIESLQDSKLQKVASILNSVNRKSHDEL